MSPRWHNELLQGWDGGFFNHSTSVLFPHRRPRRKMSHAKRKFISSYLGILYIPPGISNLYLNFKLRRRKILWLALRSDFLFAPTWIYLEIWHYVEIILQAPRNLFPFGTSLDCTWELKSLYITYRGFLFAFDGAKRK